MCAECVAEEWDEKCGEPVLLCTLLKNDLAKSVNQSTPCPAESMSRCLTILKQFQKKKLKSTINYKLSRNIISFYFEGGIVAPIHTHIVHFTKKILIQTKNTGKRTNSFHFLFFFPIHSTEKNYSLIRRSFY